MVITGTNGADTLTGTSGADHIYGLEGGDFIDGKAGDDVIEGGNGGGYLIGGLGNDTVSGGDDGDNFFYATYLEMSGNDVLTGGNGNDDIRDYYGDNTLDGGSGDDFFYVLPLDGGSSVATGGPGRDLYRVSNGGPGQFAITDFATGSGGDLIDVDVTLSHTTYSGGNPFDPANGFLRLLQSGADTLLQLDRDGASGDTYSWETLLTLRSVPSASVSSDNIEGGIPPDGSVAPGTVITGTSEADRLTGGYFNDTINGLDGPDLLAGKGGDDLVDGGAGDDAVSGGVGNDTVLGGSGNDNFMAWLPLVEFLGDDSLLGGDGDDNFQDYYGDNTIDGGTGNDFFDVDSRNGGSNLVTGGAGRDLYHLAVAAGNIDFQVTDFAAGAGGDLLDVDALLAINASNGSYLDGNPFDPGIGVLRLLQSGPDTLLQWDSNGAEDGGTIVTLLKLRGAVAASLTADNLFGGIPPDNSVLPGTVVTMTAQDTVIGALSDDTISGSTGNDWIGGKGGNDLLDGGPGNDLLSGGFGNDTVMGGDGDDSFAEVNLPRFETNFAYGDDYLVGGTGNDRFQDSVGSNRMEGGPGDDTFLIDTLYFDAGVDTATGGEGRDTYAFGPNDTATGYLFVVTDFATGPGGDLLDVDYLLSVASRNGYAGGDPFSESLGYLRLLQSGNDTLLRFDVDGAAGDAAGWRTAITLQGVEKSAITSDNFSGQLLTGTPGDDTLIGGIGNDTIQGLAGNDLMDGSLGADEISGDAGNDTLKGGAGSDTMTGGDGNDTYYVNARGDQVIEQASASALTAPGAGVSPEGTGSNIDTVIAQVSYTLGANVENLRLSGTTNFTGTGNGLDNLMTGNAADNRLLGAAGRDLIDGAGGNDTLDGGTGNDTLGGGSGADVLVGGTGNDRLTGGGGADAFVFATALSATGNKDTITDFVPGSDRIRVDDDVFAGLMPGALAPEQFYSGPGVTAVHDANDRILYNTSTGALYYDADGMGPTAALPFAVLGTSPHPSITAADFVIVS